MSEGGDPEREIKTHAILREDDEPEKLLKDCIRLVNLIGWDTPQQFTQVQFS